MNTISMQRTRGISRWLELANLTTALTSLFVASTLLILVHYITLRHAIYENVNVQARVVGENSIAALLFSDHKASRDTLSSLNSSQSIEAVSVFAGDGRPLGSFERDGIPPVEYPSPELIHDGHRFGISYLELVRRVKLDEREIGLIVVRANLSQLYRSLIGYAGLIFSVAIGSLMVAYLLVARMRKMVRNAERNLDYLAHIDPVTGLPNRHSFNEQLALAISKADQVGGGVELLLLDLDNFKMVNDTLGHPAGDSLLKLVAHRLRSSMRSSDIICRTGGDEFAVIIEVLGANRGVLGRAAGAKLLTVMDAPFVVGTRELYVTASVGSSYYPDDASDLETLTRNADAAMYQAKERGKNAYEQFRPELEQRAQKRLVMESGLRKAIERGELILHYQPQVNVTEGRVVAVEALLRWNHPEMGLVSPVDFIPIAEESGLIVPIGRWVIYAACQQVVAWRAAGLGRLSLSVNVSARQMRDPHLVQDVLGALQESGLPPGDLELEITETILMDSAQANMETLNRLKVEGVRLSIDDFGTGYSSMAYLKRFPINEVKIDRTFVNDIPGDRDGESITNAIIVMAQNLGLSVVAEGVETQKQLSFLRDAGCHIIQGFFLSRPLSPPDLEAYLRAAHVPEEKFMTVA